MAVQGTDKLLVNRAGVSYQALYTDLTQGVTSDITIGTSDADGAQVIIERDANVEFPHLSLRRTTSNGTDIKMMSFLLDGDDGESTNLYDNANISLKTATNPNSGDTSVVESVALQFTAPGGIVFGTGSSERARVKSDGTINFSNVDTYADNASAKSGGLVDGDLYKTATGEVRIKLA